MVSKFLAAILKDVAYESSFVETHGTKMLRLLIQMVMNKSMRETVQQALICMFRISEQEKHVQFFIEEPEILQRIEDFFITFQSNESLIIIILKIVSNLYYNASVQDYIINYTDINERIDFIYEKITKKQNKGQLNKNDLEVLKVLQAIIQNTK